MSDKGMSVSISIGSVLDRMVLLDSSHKVLSKAQKT